METMGLQVLYQEVSICDSASVRTLLSYFWTIPRSAITLPGVAFPPVINVRKWKWLSY